MRSGSHAMRPLPLPPSTPGQVWLSPMPGRFQPWPSFMAEARRLRLARIVCLAPLDEVAELSPDYHAAVVTGHLPCRWQALPMRNFGIADELSAFEDGIAEVADGLGRGEAVLLHCAAGIGRTGTAAACLLKRLGLPADEALRRVRQAGSNPESALQSGLIERF